MFIPIRLRHKAQLEGRASDIFGFGNKKARRTTFNHVHGPSPRHDIHASAALPAFCHALPALGRQR